MTHGVHVLTFTIALYHLANSLNKSLGLIERITMEIMDLHLLYLSNISVRICKIFFKAGIANRYFSQNATWPIGNFNKLA